MREPVETSLSELPGATGEPMRRFFRYDECGRRIEILVRFGPLGVHRTVISYNEQGDQSSAISYDEERVHEFDESGHILSVPICVNVHQSLARFSYDYDAHGNWVKQVIDGTTDLDKEWVVSNIEYRTITYSTD